VSTAPLEKPFPRRNGRLAIEFRVMKRPITDAMSSAAGTAIQRLFNAFIFPPYTVEEGTTKGSRNCDFPEPLTIS
jgi:hypothetical protein